MSFEGLQPSILKGKYRCFNRLAPILKLQWVIEMINYEIWAVRNVNKVHFLWLLLKNFLSSKYIVIFIS